MIDTSLIRLDEAIEIGQKLSSESKVLLPIGEEADIYGFIATDNSLTNPSIDMPPLGECHVLSNRIISTFDKQQYLFPIFRSVGKAIAERYPIYLLHIPRFINLSSEWDRKAYLYSMSREIPNPKVARIDGIKLDEKVAYYYPKEDDLFFESRSKLRAIGSEFVVVTRRISKLSDNIKYEIFDSHSVMIERDEKNAVM